MTYQNDKGEWLIHNVLPEVEQTPEQLFILGYNELKKTFGPIGMAHSWLRVMNPDGTDGTGYARKRKAMDEVFAVLDRHRAALD